MNAFLQAEALELSPAYAGIQRKLLKEGGVMDLSPHTILEMKDVLAEYREYQAKHGKGK